MLAGDKEVSVIEGHDQDDESSQGIHRQQTVKPPDRRIDAWRMMNYGLARVGFCHEPHNDEDRLSIEQ